MKLEAVFPPSLVFIDVEFDSYDDIFIFLSKEFGSLAGIDFSRILNELKKREKITPTYLGNSTALPHCRLDEVPELMAAFIKLKRPLKLEVDGIWNEVKYVFSILTPLNSENTYIGILSRISKFLLKEQGTLDEICSREDFFNKLNHLTDSINTRLTAKELCSKHPVINHEASIKEAVDLMKKEQIILLPVVNSNNNIIGVISVADIIRCSFPDYVYNLIDFSFVKEFQPLEAFWDKESRIQVNCCMKDAHDYLVDQGTSYLEILFLMSKFNRHHLIVINQNRIYQGVITPNTILNNMLRP